MDNLEDKIREIVEYCAESYYPEHEYGNSHADQNKEYLEEAVQQLKGLLVDAQPGWVIESPTLPYFQIEWTDGNGEYAKSPIYDTKNLPAILQQTRQEEVREL